MLELGKTKMIIFFSFADVRVLEIKLTTGGFKEVQSLDNDINSLMTEAVII